LALCIWQSQAITNSVVGHTSGQTWWGKAA